MGRFIEIGCIGAAAVSAAIVGVLAAPAAADINVELRPAVKSVTAGDPVAIGLYAVSDDAGDQLLAALQVIIAWQPEHLQFLGNNDDGAVKMLSSEFPPDPFGLNENDPPKDGDGLYVGLAPLADPVAATPEGTLITTFEFEALLPTDGTPIDVLEEAGEPPTHSIVFDGTEPNLDVTGTLTGALVVIEPCCLPDLDGDCNVGTADLLALLAAWGSNPGGPPDLDRSGTVGTGDLLILLAAWGPCP